MSKGASVREGGTAFIQIRFDRGSVRTAARRWGYPRNLSTMATWRVEAFWEAVRDAGFTPQAAFLLPYQPLKDTLHLQSLPRAFAPRSRYRSRVQRPGNPSQ